MRARTADDVGRLARQRRQDQGRSQAEVAEAAGVTRQWLVRFEQGRSDVSLRNVMAVLTALKLELALEAQAPHPRTHADRAEVPMIEWEDSGTSEALGRGRALLEQVLRDRLS
ncbi:helix-turn-helix domain-containing protein [Herbiconiux sp. YIM B11900]|uniref:helix-turn-helix domain-containing protein n=1 Tax=Herbiconiux sp. YIM B11900 TaxID=3404131 RepID=UPI003F84AABA